MLVLGIMMRSVLESWLSTSTVALLSFHHGCGVCSSRMAIALFNTCCCVHHTVCLQVYFLWDDTVVPAVLQSDNGTEFCAAIMKELCAMYGVQHVQGSVGHPQSQGAVERANKIVKDKIRAELMRADTTRCVLSARAMSGIWAGCVVAA